MIIFVISLIISIIILIIVYNAIVTSRNAVIRAWSDIVAYQREKLELIAQLRQLTDQFMEHERNLMTNITSLRSSINKLDNKVVDTKNLADIENYTGRFMRHFNMVVENYPMLLSSNIVMKTMTEMTNIENIIAAAITVFNRNIADFNTLIEMFPNNLLNWLFFKYKVYDEFRDSKSESGFEYKFNK
jgi:LemA protein